MDRLNRAGEWAIVIGVWIICAGLLAGLAGQLPAAVALDAIGLLWVVAGLLGVGRVSADDALGCLCLVVLLAGLYVLAAVLQ